MIIVSKTKANCKQYWENESFRKKSIVLMLVVDKVNLNYATPTFSVFSDEENYMQVIMVNGYRILM